jgi:uncharacterized alpha/beta hydrolase family protein
MNCNADVASDDIKALMEHYKVSKITLVGHDWGAGVAYRLQKNKLNLNKIRFKVPKSFEQIDYFEHASSIDQTFQVSNFTNIKELVYSLFPIEWNF